MKFYSWGFSAGSGTSVWFDNLRFTGPAGAKLVDGFETTQGWDPKISKLTTLEADPTVHTEGHASAKVGWDKLPSDGFNRRFPTAAPAVSPKEFDELKLDLKFAGARPASHIRGIGDQIDLGDQIMDAARPTASVEQRGHDACAQVRYAWYERSDSSLERMLVLLADGTLVVHDVLTPGKSMDGWNAGTLWQLYELQSSGPGWFASADDGPFPAAELGGPKPQLLRMVVRFEGSQTAVETIDQLYSDKNPKQRKPVKFSTTFAQQAVVAGKPVGFTYVVLPQASDKDAAFLADQVNFAVGNSAAQATVTLKNDSKKTVVSIDGDQWSITR